MTTRFLDTFSGAGGPLATHTPEIGTWQGAHGYGLETFTLPGNGTIVRAWTDPGGGSGAIGTLVLEGLKYAELDFIMLLPGGTGAGQFAFIIESSLELGFEKFEIGLFNDYSVGGYINAGNESGSNVMLEYPAALTEITNNVVHTLRMQIGESGAGCTFFLDGVQLGSYAGITIRNPRVVLAYDTFDSSSAYAFSRLAVDAEIPPSAFWDDLVSAQEDIASWELTKDLIIMTTAGSPGVPSAPSTPGAPAYDSYENVEVCGFRVAGGEYGWVYPSDGGQPQYMLLATYAGAGYPAISTYSCATVKKLVHHDAVPSSPAIPGVPATAETFTHDFQLGWNAGARSQQFLRGDGSANFTVESAVGVVAGFNSENLGAGYAEIEHGIMVSSGLVRVVESGATVYTIGTFTAGDQFTIKRRAGEVTYWRNGALVYTSEQPSTGTVFLDVSMYSGGDRIASPSLTGASGGAEITLPALQSMGGKAIAQAAVVLPALTVAAGWYQGAAIVLPALQVFGGRRSAMAAIMLPALQASGEGGFGLPRYALATPILPALQASGYMLTGQIANAALVLPALVARGEDRIYGEARVLLPALRVFSTSYEGPLQASIAGLSFAADSMTGTAELFLAFSSSGQFAAALTVGRVRTALLDDGAIADDAMTAQAIIKALMESGALALVTGAVDAPGRRNDDWQIWSVDWDSGGSTAYENFGFNSFSTIGGRHFGARADGVYLLEGGDDAGEPIRASVHFGRHDFGTSQQKRVPNVYAGVSAGGDLLLRVQVDGGPAYLYNARAVDVAQKVTRFDLGRGLKGSYYVFELYNEQGADFDLDSIEFLPVALTRRI